MSLIFLFVSVGAFAGNRPQSLAEFRATCLAHMSSGTHKWLPKPKVGKTIYVPVQNLVAGQTRFSYLRMLKQLDDILAKNGNNTTPYNDGRSAFAKKKARGGIYYRGKVYLFDRHHHTLANIYLGGQTMPVSIRGDWSRLSREEFEARILRTGLRYPYGVDGKIHPIPDLCELVDDPYLYLPEFYMATVKTAGRKHKVVGIAGAKTAIFVKVDEGKPYTELEMADALIKAKFVLPDLMQDLSISILNEVSDIIEESIEEGYSRLSDVGLLDEAARVKDLDLQKIVDEYYSKPLACRAYLHTPRESQ